MPCVTGPPPLPPGSSWREILLSPRDRAERAGENQHGICINSSRYNKSAAKHNIGNSVPPPSSLVLPDGAPRADQRVGAQPQPGSQHGCFLQPRPRGGVRRDRSALCSSSQPHAKAAERPAASPASRAADLFPLTSEKVKKKKRERERNRSGYSVGPTGSV